MCGWRSLVALGAGALSVPGSLTALACSPLVAGLVGKLRLATARGTGAAVALGPYLAVGGLTMVMAHACTDAIAAQRPRPATVAFSGGRGGQMGRPRRWTTGSVVPVVLAVLRRWFRLRGACRTVRR